MKPKNHKYRRFLPRSRPMRRPRGALLTAEEDLSPDSSPKNPSLEKTVPDLVPSPKNPSLEKTVPDLVPSPPPSISSVADLPCTDPPQPSSTYDVDDPRPWVKLRQRKLPHYFYRRLPNWFYPHLAVHEPYTPHLYNIGRSQPEPVVAVGEEPAADSEVQCMAEEDEEEEEDVWNLYP